MKSATLTLLLSALATPPSAPAQTPKPIFDARLTLKPSPLSAIDEELIKSKVGPAARNVWQQSGRDQLCVTPRQVRAIDVAPGAFTRPGASQRAILYTYCEVGHNRILDGIVIVESGQIATHIVFEGAENHAIGALPDINGNGLLEIVIASGGTNMGQTWGVVSILEAGASKVVRLGRTDTFSDNCGVDENHCSVQASRISVKPGNKPEFFGEKFIRAGDDGPWKKAGAIAPIKLQTDDTEYQVL